MKTKKQDNQIRTEQELEIVLNSIREYYQYNACTTKARIDNKPSKETCLTVSQLLLGATELCTTNLKDFKNGVSQ